jgi:hypothetical protein
MELGQLKVGQFLSHQALWYDTCYTPAILEYLVCQNSHQPTVTAAINEFGAVCCQQTPQLARGLLESGAFAYAGPTKDT